MFLVRPTEETRIGTVEDAVVTSGEEILSFHVGRSTWLLVEVRLLTIGATVEAIRFSIRLDGTEIMVAIATTQGTPDYLLVKSQGKQRLSVVAQEAAANTIVAVVKATPCEI